jgi:hypothetical protein
MPPTGYPTTSEVPISESEEFETVNRAFRMKKSVLEALQQEAKERGISVNWIVDDCLAKHVFDYRVLRKFHPIIEEAGVIKLLCEAIPEERIIKIGEEMANSVEGMDLSSSITRNDSAESCLEAIRIWAQQTGDYEYSEEIYGDKDVIILGDNLGKNWSLLEATYWKTVLKRKGLDVEVSATEDAAILRYRKSDLNRLLQK